MNTDLIVNTLFDTGEFGLQITNKCSIFTFLGATYDNINIKAIGLWGFGPGSYSVPTKLRLGRLVKEKDDPNLYWTVKNEITESGWEIISSHRIYDNYNVPLDVSIFRINIELRGIKYGVGQ